MIRGNGWVFVENPKTASCSINAALKEGIDKSVHKHSTLMSVKWDEKFRFVVVRNPYARMVSGWAHITRCRVPFGEWLLDPTPWELGVGLDFKRVPQTTWAWHCTHALRFENMDHEWQKFGDLTGIRRELPQRNVGPSLDWCEVVTPDLGRVIADRMAPDFHRWGYEC